MKKYRKKGFTLVEIIVVMLILAILASMFIPNMMGYLERAGESEAVMECRSTVISVQTILNQTVAYGTDEFEGVYKGVLYQIKTSASDTGDSGVVVLRNFSGINPTLNGVICGIAQSEGEISNMRIDENCRLMYLLYTASNGNTVEYDYRSDTGYRIVK